MELEMHQSGDTLFRVGEIADKFYIILKGNLSVLIVDEKLVEMLIEDYYKHLKNLKDSHEYYMFKRIFEANLENFNKIHIYPTYKEFIDDISRIEDILFKVKLKKMLKTHKKVDPDLILRLYQEFKKDLSDYNFNKVMYEYDPIELWCESMLNELDYDKDIERYYHIYMIGDSRLKYTLCYYGEVLMLKEGNYFGEAALSINNRRKATVKIDTECHLGSIDQKLYDDYLLKEQHKIILKEINFLLENYFFKNVKPYSFEKKYLSFLTYKELPRGYEIFKENSQVEELIFIKEGELELSLTCSVMDIHTLVNHIFENNPKIKERFNKNMQYELKVNPKVFGDELNKRKLYKLYKYIGVETLGLEEIHFQLNHIYRAKVTSEKLKFYSIEIDKLKKIFDFEKASHEEFQIKAIDKMTLFLKRLIGIKNQVLYEIEKQDNYKSKINIDDFSKNLNSVKFERQLDKIGIKNINTLTTPYKKNLVKEEIDQSKNILIKADDEKSFVVERTSEKKTTIQEIDQTSFLSPLNSNKKASILKQPSVCFYEDVQIKNLKKSWERHNSKSINFLSSSIIHNNANDNFETILNESPSQNNFFGKILEIEVPDAKQGLHINIPTQIIEAVKLRPTKISKHFKSQSIPEKNLLKIKNEIRCSLVNLFNEMPNFNKEEYLTPFHTNSKMSSLDYMVKNNDLIPKKVVLPTINKFKKNLMLKNITGMLSPFAMKIKRQSSIKNYKDIKK